MEYVLLVSGLYFWFIVLCVHINNDTLLERVIFRFVPFFLGTACLWYAFVEFGGLK